MLQSQPLNRKGKKNEKMPCCCQYAGSCGSRCRTSPPSSGETAASAASAPDSETAAASATAAPSGEAAPAASAAASDREAVAASAAAQTASASSSAETEKEFLVLLTEVVCSVQSI